MTPEEIILSAEEELQPEAIEVDAVDTQSAEALTQLLTDPEPAAAPEEIPEEQPEEPVLMAEPAPVVKKVKKTRRKPHIALRILLQLISLVLSVVLFATVISGALVADLRQMTSAGGIKQLISVIIGAATAAAPAAPQEEIYVSNLSNWTIHYDETETTGGDVDLGDLEIDPDNLPDLDEIPEDILTGGATEENMGSLVDWIYEQIEQSTDDELTVSKDQVQSFVEQSTVGDYLSDKLAGFADDFINGTENTTITTDEIMDLLEENRELLESELQIEFTEEQKTQLQESVSQFVEGSDINNTIRQEVYNAVDGMLEANTESMGGLSVEDIQAGLQLLVSDSLFNAFVILSAVLLLLLCLVNFYNIPAGLTWAGIPCILAGGILSLPIAILQDNSALVTGAAPEAGAVVDLLSSFLDIFKPIHFGLLYIGVGLVAVSIVWRFIRAVVRKVQAG